MDRLSYAKRHSQIIVLTTEHCCEENAVNGCPCLDKKGPEARTMVMERERQKSNKFDIKTKTDNRNNFAHSSHFSVHF